jgi:putative ATP-dependent endonuclease of the OLD family
MRIKSITITNFRGFNIGTIPLEAYTCLVGPNGAGKSTILCALNIFFRETAHSSVDLKCLEREDFHHRNTSEPIRIRVTFADLSPDAQEDFKDYYRNSELTITAEAAYDSAAEHAIVKHFGERLGMPEFAQFFKAYGNGASAADLRGIFGQIQAVLPDLGKATAKEAMKDALRAYETARPERCELLPSEDEFYGVSKGANRLAKYAQWVYVPALKDAVSEETATKDTALARLLDRVVQSKVNFDESIKALREKAQVEYDLLLDQNQPVLADVSADLARLLGQYAHPEATCRVAWRQDIDRSVKVEAPLAVIIAGEGHFEGGLARFGHGLQRSLLLALLQLVAGISDAKGPKLLLGCEEPELFQHPPQARHLADVFEQLSAKGEAQIIVSTHSPYFVVGKGVEGVRLVRKDPGVNSCKVNYTTFDKVGEMVATATGEPPPKKLERIRARLHQELQPLLNEIFFSPIVVLVEGLEDIAYITTHLHLSGKWDAFRKHGCHLVPAGGKSHMPFSLSVMKLLEIPFFAVWDADALARNRAQHEKENKAILLLCGEGALDPFPATHTFAPNHTLWAENLSQAVDADLAGTDWEKLKEAYRIELGQPGGLEKNTMFLSETLTRAYEKHLVSSSLEKLCANILTFARSQAAPPEASCGLKA